MSAPTTRRLAVLGTTLAAGAVALSVSGDADAISRDEVMTTTRSYALHPWHSTSANQTVSCVSGYNSWLDPGDYLGVAYDWGGFSSIFEFDQEIANDYGAGSYNNYDGWAVGQPGPACTTGIDCSGYVSRAWGLSGKIGTYAIPDYSHGINAQDALAGDVFNQAGFHVKIMSHRLSDGSPVIYEATPPYHAWAWATSWSNLGSYTPLRYDNITGGDAGNPVGTTANPIVVPAFPGAIYTDTRNTDQSTSDVYDGCGVAPGTDESGPEYIYEVTINQPGTLRVHVDGYVPGSLDIDVHLYESMNTNDCVARDHIEFFHPVDCGTYYVVADTFGGDSNGGQYTLTIELQNPSGSCGSGGPDPYDYEGGLGTSCANSNTYCNPNFWNGELYCLTVGSAQYCTGPCSSNAECDAHVPGACCEPTQSGENVCMLPQHCTGTGPGGSGAGGGGVGNGGPGGGGVGGGGTGNFGGDGTGATSGGSKKKDKDDEGGCALVSPGTASQGPGGLALAALLLLGPAAWRRRRTARRRVA